MGLSYSTPTSANGLPNTSSSGPQTVSRPPNSKCFAVLLRVSWVVLSILIIISLVMSIAWLILNPKLPLFGVNSLTVSNFTLSDHDSRSVSGDIEIFARNPNKKIQMYFNNVDIHLCYRGRHVISVSSNMTGVSLDHVENTAFGAALKANSRCFRKNCHNSLCSVKKKDFKKLRENSSSGDDQAVNFNVKMLVSTTSRAGNWFTMKGSMVVSCRNLEVTFSSPKAKGKLKEGRDHNCQVRHFSSD
ncbi:hypothetical protein CJ030_MR1G009591 [Morella rubra]|uniref:Late embryogenesis abundant protein LEA-2 subgroup domain-containing protein n=1 Tax=Morella rubra TaxID=262757 RepID=A0A6A1WWL4_9ROSI|nr:hypothetical protein CJ030_MR1G009591 [Morella rubra]